MEVGEIREISRGREWWHFAKDYDSRMSWNPRNHDSHSRAKSLLRFNELERERSRRRQTIVKQKTSSKLFPGKLKLSMMNTSVIPLQKGMPS